MSAYQVRLNVFEGPFDLLLHLVRVNEMDIYDIPIADITRQYLHYIKEMEQLDLEVAGDFLVMASTLIQIKSRTLAPLPRGEEEEEEEEIDEEAESIRDAQDLMRRLVEYRQFKEMAVDLADKEEKQLRVFYRNEVLPKVEGSEAAPMREDINLLFSAFARVLAYTEGRPIHHVTEEEFSVEEKIEIIRRSLNRDQQVSVKGLFEKCLNKQEVITTFLALLEMCRMRECRVRQKGNFEDIVLIHPSVEEIDDDEEDF